MIWTLVGWIQSFKEENGSNFAHTLLKTIWSYIVCAENSPEFFYQVTLGKMYEMVMQIYKDIIFFEKKMLCGHRYTVSITGPKKHFSVLRKVENVCMWVDIIKVSRIPFLRKVI